MLGKTKMQLSQLAYLPPSVQIVLQPLSLGTSNDLVVGQHVYALGNPFGLDHSLTTGACSPAHSKVAEHDTINTKAARH